MKHVSDAMGYGNEGGYRHVVNVSGGKDSAALALYLLDRYPDVRVEYVFCDTGCELPETYQYLGRLEALLGQPISYLNALDLIGVAKRPGRNPFDIWLNEVYGGFLPSPRARWCTRVLKIKPFEHHIGEDKAFSYIGIRSDEDREGYKWKKPPVISEQPNIIPVYPFKDDGLGLHDIRMILEDSGLGLPSYYELRRDPPTMRCHRTDDHDEEHSDSALFWPIGQEVMVELARYLLDDGASEEIASLRDRLMPLSELSWELHNVPWRHLVLVPVASEERPWTNWKMRSEDRKPSLDIAKEILWVQAGYHSPTDDDLQGLRQRWEGLLLPALHREEIDELWAAIMDGVVR